MFGRHDERRYIETLLDNARSGDSGAVVIHGEPGVGKSMLLDQAAANATDMRVLSCSGLETEHDLAYGGLHQLVRPVLSLADRLPLPQQDSLMAALGLVPRKSTDRFLVGAAVLTLLSEAAEDRPVLCLVDDLQWIDQASIEALIFAARRLVAESVAVVAATRAVPPLGIPDMPLDGLDREAAMVLLTSERPELAPEARERLLTDTAGNPLALLELADTVSSDHVEANEPRPLSEWVQQAFYDKVRRLSAEARQLMLIAAAEDAGNLRLIAQAADTIGVGVEALDEATRAGLIDHDTAGRLSFRHPLVRSAVYHGAEASDRHAVHRALADACGGPVERRIWHLAASTPGADDAVADDLHELARQAERRGAHATAMTAYVRSAELSTDADVRGRRLADGAREGCASGAVDRAMELATQAAPLLESTVDLARLTAVRAELELSRGDRAAMPIFLEAAKHLAPHDIEGTVTVLTQMAWVAETYARPGYAEDVAAAFADLDLSPTHPLRPVVDLYRGFSELATGDLETGLPRMQASIQALKRQAEDGEATFLPSVLVFQDTILAVGDHTSARIIMEAQLAACHAQGLMGRLPFAMGALAYVEIHAGRHVRATELATEALQLARDLGMDYTTRLNAALLTWLAAAAGRENDFDRYLPDVITRAERCGAQMLVDVCPWWSGKLHLALGQPDDALAQLRQATKNTEAWTLAGLAIVPDLVEASARAGQPAIARVPLARFERWIRIIDAPWMMAVLHRCHALLADDASAEEHYRAALIDHDRAGADDRPTESAHTHLLYGEWLRRQRRRREAVVHLETARTGFEKLRAPAWVDRADAELRACGRQKRVHDPLRLPTLTPQELIVVRLAAEGRTNKEIGTRLFLSPRTVGYHLSNAYAKLGLASRRELAQLNLDDLASGG